MDELDYRSFVFFMLWIRLWLSLMLSTTVLLLHQNHQNLCRTLSSSDEDFFRQNPWQYICFYGFSRVGSHSFQQKVSRSNGNRSETSSSSAWSLIILIMIVIILMIIMFVRVKGIDLRPRPTDMRRSRHYVIFYHTWVWGFTTGRIHILNLKIFADYQH